MQLLGHGAKVELAEGREKKKLSVNSDAQGQGEIYCWKANVGLEKSEKMCGDQESRINVRGKDVGFLGVKKRNGPGGIKTMLVSALNPARCTTKVLEVEE